MPTKPSDVVRKIAGLFIEDTSAKKPDVISWIQNECRQGSLRSTIDRFVDGQLEELDSDLLLVESTDPNGVICSIPFKSVDHESPSPFQSECRFFLNPKTGEIKTL